jgi:hypothetical protein
MLRAIKPKDGIVANRGDEAQIAQDLSLAFM